MYYPQLSYGNGGSYATSSKRKSLFTSKDLHSERRAMRSPTRAHNNKQFIQLNEYELRLGDGSNHTHVERGPVNGDDALILPIQSTTDLPQFPMPTYSTRPKAANKKPPHAISVRKDYSVTVEISPDRPDSGTRGDDEEEGLVSKK